MDFLDSSVDVPCPQCGHEVRTTLRAIKNGRVVSCSSGHQIQLKEEGSGISQADREMKKLERSIKDLNRQLRKL